MKKITLIFTLFLFIVFSSYSQVQVGFGTIKSNAPIDLRYDSTYSQSIYLASEINASGKITSIQWYFDSNYQTSTNQITDIYIGHTSKSQFSSNTDWVSGGSLTKVFSGRFVTNGTKGWKTITLTTPFDYNGSSNIVVAANSKNNSEASHAPFNGIYYFSSTASSVNRTLITQTDGTIYNPQSPPGFSFESKNVPNIIFGGITQTCPLANGVKSSNLTTTTATIRWEVSNPAPALGSEYYYSTSNTEPNSGTIPNGSVTSGVTANLSPLLPGTVYYVWVRNKCGTDSYSSWSTMATFTTVCLDVDYFFENFDEVTTPNLPTCWTKILRGTGLTSNSSVATYTSEYVISPPNMVELFASSSPNTADIMLVTPKLSNLGAGTNRLKFYAKAGQAKQIVIGTLDNNTNTAVFTPFKTITLNILWKQYEVDFKDYRGSNKYIAFKTIFDPSFDISFADLDNILWEPNPACLDAEGLIVPATTPNSATVNWDQIGAPQYQIVYGISNDTFPTGLTPLAPTSGIQEELTNLLPNTTYSVWLRTICANEEYGTWSDPVLFTTPCEAEPEVGFYENFNNVVVPNLPNCWSKIIRGATSSPFCRVETDEYSDILPQPNITALLYNAESNDITDDVILVSPKLSTLQSGTYRLRFIARYTGYAAGLETGTLNNNTNFADFNIIQTNELTNNATEYVVDFNVYTGTDTFIGIRLKASQWYSTVEIDNIIWEIAPSCPDVSDINVITTTSNSVTVGWTDGGSSESFDVAVIAPNNVDPGSSAYTNTSENQIEISGLSANTTYSIWVRSVCAGNDLGRWIGPVNFTTACAQVAIFDEDFQNSNIPELPACWSKILRGNTLPFQANIETTFSYLPEETKAVLIKNLDSGASDDVILVTPNLSTLTTGAYRLRFKAKGDNVGILEFGTLNSNLNNAIFTSINQTIIPSSTTTEYIIDFNGSYGSDTFVGIRAVSQYTYVELDNIVWEPIPTCPDVKNVVLETATKTTATIYWDAGNATNWEVAVGATSVTDPNSITPIDTNIPAVVLSDLSIGTCYNIWVRSICDVSLGNGKWSNPIEICTQCDATNVPYSQNFETAVLPKMPLCTSAVNLSAGSANWYIENDPGYGFTSNTLTYNSDLYTDANAWFFTQGVNLEFGKNYTISYRYGGASTDTEFYNNSLKVMYGKEAAESFMTLPIADYPFFAVDSPVSQSYTISPPSSGVYYFGFNVYSPNNSNYMFIDDIKIDTGLSNNQFDVTSFNYYPNPIKDILNISNFNKITSISVYNLLGQEVSTKSVNNNIAKVDMSALASGTYMIKITSNEVTKTIKVIKQ